jgi:hypothetical protein
MAIEYRWAVDAASNQFLYGGGANTMVPDDYDVEPGLSPGQFRVVLSRPPRPRLERYSGDPLNPFRAATAAEITAQQDSEKDSEASSGIDGAKAIKSTVICALWGRLNRQPTAPEIAAERTRWLTIYKNL